MADSVKVAVRLRPFNTREKDNNSKLIIKMNGQKTTIVDPTTNEKKDFTFDYSFWSHDKSQEFATQTNVFQELGVDVLKNAWEGYNVSLFAYGQTGSGKSYSMVGYGPEKGIIPLACEEMFNRISANTDPNLTYKVEASMMEIYNEQVRDLFNPKSNKPGGLKVRENPATGPYVEDLSSCLVKSYSEIDRLMEEGSRSRTVASTNMNATSSRAHTLFQIIFSQTKVDPTAMKASDKVSKINLIDLAGSERAESTGATGDRLKEGSAINKSLSALGNCISALAEQSKPGPKKKQVFVPYRDSVLTWLLKESLGGNARTIMIAALSPADINYEETLSTLRYADRAKQIKTKAVVNEDPNEKLIRELRAEIEKLRTQMSPDAHVTAAAAAAVDPQLEAEMVKLREQLMESQKIIEKMTMSDAEKEQRTKEIAQDREDLLAENGLTVAHDVNVQTQQLPHFVNLNEDPLMSECLIYFFKEGVTRIGRKNPENPPDIQLNGLNIQKDHCLVKNEGGEVTLTPCANARVFVNGQVATDTVKLSQGFRVILGQNHVFRFNHPTELARLRAEKEAASEAAEAEQATGGELMGWEFALKELAEAQGRFLKLDDEKEKEKERELEAQLKAMEEKLQKEREDQQRKMEEERKALEEQSKQLLAEMAQKEEALKAQISLESESAAKAKLEEMQSELSKQQEKMQEALKEQQEELDRKNRELEQALVKQKELSEEFAQRKAKEKRDRTVLEDKLIKAIPMVNEANAIAEELEYPLHFEIKLISTIQHGANMDLPDEMRYQKQTDIMVKMQNTRTNTSVGWSFDKFTNRIYLMREMYMNFMDTIDTNEEFVMSKEHDPFYDPPEDQLIGVAMVYLKPLAHLIDTDDLVPLLDYKGKDDGVLSVVILPVGEDGDPDNAPDVDQPEDLIGGRLDFFIRLPFARGLPQTRCDQVYARYKFFLDDEYVETKRCEKASINPELDFEKLYTIKPVTAEFVKYLQSDAISFEVYGRPQEEDGWSSKAGSGSRSPTSPGDKPMTAAAKRRENISQKQAELDRIHQEKDRAEEEKNSMRLAHEDLLKQKDDIERQKQATEHEKAELARRIQELEELTKAKERELKSKADEESAKLKQLEDLKKKEVEDTRRAEADRVAREYEAKLKELSAREEEKRKEVERLKSRVEEVERAKGGEVERLKKEMEMTKKEAESTKDKGSADSTLMSERTQKEILEMKRQLQEMEKKLKDAEEKAKQAHNQDEAALKKAQEDVIKYQAEIAQLKKSKACVIL